MKWTGTLAVIFTLTFVMILTAVVAGYIAIRGLTFITIDAKIYNVDPAGRPVYFQLAGKSVKTLSSQQAASIKVSPSTLINAGFSPGQLNLAYRVPSTKTYTFYIFQDSIQDNISAFNLAIINASPIDVRMWALDTTTHKPISLSPPDIGPGGRTQIPVYTNEILKFAPIGTTYSDAPYVFVVQMYWMNELYIGPSGLTISRAKQ